MIRFVCVLVCLLLSAAPAVFGQLTDQDITALQEQGRQEGWTFTVSRNPATEYSIDQLCGLVPPDKWWENARFDPCEAKRDLPAAFDWRDSATMPIARNQGGCGSCWAFATVGPLECNIAIWDGEIVDLSEQYLVSCNSDGMGCDGGWWAHDYHQWKTDPCDSTGAVLEAWFPYQASEVPCSCPYPHEYLIDSWSYVGFSGGIPSIGAMKTALVNYGPLSVGVTVNGAFQGYSGGIFNNCDGSGDINHGVTLVGWDDDQGDYGVWIIRNSWGPWWGEDGYMRIPYLCSSIGYGSAYISYLGSASFVADTTYGPIPLDVQFTCMSPLQVDTHTWDFGDGDSAFVADPSHTYDSAGIYDVTLEIVAEGQTYSRTRGDYIIALADTMRADSIIGAPGDVIHITVSGRNTVPANIIKVPIEWSGDLNLTLQAFTTEGCRTEAFEEQEFQHYDAFNKRFTLSLGCGGADPMAPGEGPIVKIEFRISSSASSDQTATIDLHGYEEYLPQFQSIYLNYSVPVIAGFVGVEESGCCVGLRGNFDNDPDDQTNIVDLTKLVDYLFFFGEDPECWEEANINGDPEGLINIVDVSMLVAYLFSSGEPPAPCP